MHTSKADSMWSIRSFQLVEPCDVMYLFQKIGQRNSAITGSFSEETNDVITLLHDSLLRKRYCGDVFIKLFLGHYDIVFTRSV